MSEDLKAFARLLLPSFIVEHFEITEIDQLADRIDFYLEEKPSCPKEYSHNQIISHGFHKQAMIKDFPIRGKQVYLYVKRRRWLIKDTKEVVSIDWKVIAEGTRLTEEFATFLKGIN
ncbi:MAG: transposase family protein [Crocinitomicaceae bacterium]|nr:transposase family protein [Crocinitomicaceae bacterium]